MSFSKAWFGLLVLILTACGSGGGSGSGDGGLSKLSPEQQQAFQAWKTSPIKTCQAVEVVGGYVSTTDRAIDLEVLAARTGNSIWLHDPTRADVFGVLSGGANAFTSGSSTSKYEETMTVNGSSQSVRVETQSSGFDCVVKINGVDVGRVSLARSVDVGVASVPQGRFQPLSMVSADTIRKLDGTTTIRTGAWTQAINTTLRSEEAVTTLAMKLGYNEAEAKKHFVLRGAEAGSGFGIEAVSSTTGSKVAYSGQSEIVMNDEQVRVLPEAGQTKTISVVSAYRTGGLSIGGVRFGAESKEVMIVRRALSLERGTLNLVVKDLGIVNVSALTPTSDMIIACAQDRVLNYSSLFKAGLRARIYSELPSRSRLFDACTALDPEIESRFIQSDLMLQSLNVLLGGVTRELVRSAGGRFQFGDWDSFVARKTAEALDPKSSAKLALQGDAVLLNELDASIQAARLTPVYSQLSPVYLAPLGSFLVGQVENSRDVTIDTALVRRAVQAAVKVGPVYQEPLSRVLLSGRGVSSSIDETLSWIELRAPESLLRVGREALAEAQALEDREFLSEFASFFTRRPTEDSLIRTRDELRALKIEFAKYPTLLVYKGDLVGAVYRNTRLNPADVSATFAAASKMAGAVDILVREFLELVRTSADSSEVANARGWGLALTATDVQLIRNYLQGAYAAGFESDATVIVRAMVKTRPTTVELQARVNAIAVSNQFLKDEASRAASSRTDMFYESSAKDLAKRIAREGFSAGEVASLEAYAQVAASEAFCGDRKTVSYRLQCVGLDKFSKMAGKLLAPEFSERNARLAGKIATWLQRLKPDFDHSSVRRSLKNGLFKSDAGPWATCASSQFDLNSRALETAVQEYIQVMGDFMQRSKAERAVSSALDVRCP